jgi:Holliday junction resolvase RusA-like endonuclease
MYARPNAAKVELRLAPVLESWNARAHPDQLRLATFLDEIEASLELSDADSNLALELQVGLPESRSLTTGGGDLDNYLFPISRRLGPARFDAMFGAKRHSATSTLVAAPAISVSASREPDMVVRTTASASTQRWKEQVRAACADAAPSIPIVGAISLDLEFRLSAARNWAATWKPAIDSLGPVLGVPNSQRAFMPNDDRIVRLGLHRALDDGLGWDIVVSAWWAAADR